MRNHLVRFLGVLCVLCVSSALHAQTTGARTGIRNGVLQNNIDFAGFKATNVAATVLADWGITDAVPSSRTVNGHALTANINVTQGDVGLGNVTNDVQTKAAIVPNTAPTAGQVLVGNAGGTAY